MPSLATSSINICLWEALSTSLYWLMKLAAAADAANRTSPSGARDDNRSQKAALLSLGGGNKPAVSRELAGRCPRKRERTGLCSRYLLNYRRPGRSCTAETDLTAKTAAPPTPPGRRVVSSVSNHFNETPTREWLWKQLMPVQEVISCEKAKGDVMRGIRK
ncbi:hypothetical protein NDU88_002101 [Pleurodeles waltl]|uniref:Uncharacterized protein n=1 Tax=Pleurodeles waltl TaxID=8319 RepID=A0AAV7QAP7_PLEWA|nr:hypothetical protein NDU88_002101 [Pleurodeles waltl]